MESEKIRILIFDDHVVFRKALMRLLSDSSSDYVIVGQASYYEDALEILRTVQCDLVLVDYSLYPHSGLEIIEIAKAEGIEAKFIILSGYGIKIYAQRSLEAGARGYILKDNPIDIVEGIQRVLNDEIYLSPLLREL